MFIGFPATSCSEPEASAASAVPATSSAPAGSFSARCRIQLPQPGCVRRVCSQPLREPLRRAVPDLRCARRRFLLLGENCRRHYPSSSFGAQHLLRLPRSICRILNLLCYRFISIFKYTQVGLILSRVVLLQIFPVESRIIYLYSKMAILDIRSSNPGFISTQIGQIAKYRIMK